MTLAKPLSELLRPQQLDDLTLPQQDIDRLQRMIDNRRVMNMVFHGAPGLGKTSAARIISKAVAEEGTLEINGSSLNGIDSVRHCVQPFATSGSLVSDRKICLIEEADYLTKNAQGSLRYIIENARINCSFLFTVNDLAKLVPAIQSRLKLVCFDIPPSERGSTLQRLGARYGAKLGALGIAYNAGRLDELIGIHWPDFRKIALQIEYEFC